MIETVIYSMVKFTKRNPKKFLFPFFEEGILYLLSILGIGFNV